MHIKALQQGEMGIIDRDESISNVNGGCKRLPRNAVRQDILMYDMLHSTQREEI